MSLSPTSDARTSQGHGSMKAAAALLLVGMLILWAELPAGRRCPRIRDGEEKLRRCQGAVFMWEGNGVLAGQPLPGVPALARSRAVPPPAGSAWSCPPVRFTCAMHNPPNQCLTDRHCPRGKKCCRTFCGRKCLSKPPKIPVSYGRSSGAPPAHGSTAGLAAVALGRAVPSCQDPPAGGRGD